MPKQFPATTVSSTGSLADVQLVSVEEADGAILVRLRTALRPAEALIARGLTGMQESALSDEEFILIDSEGHQFRVSESAQPGGAFLGLLDLAFPAGGEFAAGAVVGLMARDGEMTIALG